MVSKTNLFLKGGKKGFSLIEAVIALAIIAMISVFMISSLNPQAKISQGKDARRKSDLKRIQTAFEDFYSDHNCYPTPPLVCGNDFKPYLDSVPCDPDGGNYFYPVPEPIVPCPQFFRIYSYLSSSNDVDIAKLGCQNGCGPASANDYDYGVSSTNVSLEKNEEISEPTVAPPLTPPPTSVFGCDLGVCKPIIHWDGTCQPNYLIEGCWGLCGSPEEPKNQFNCPEQF